jgi:hypothetical protein
MSDAEDSESKRRFRDNISRFSFQKSTSPDPRRNSRRPKKRAELPPSQLPIKTRPSRRGFAPPEKYSHLNALKDYLAPDLDSMLIVCNALPTLRIHEYSRFLWNQV